jgi:hypothetical protein
MIPATEEGLLTTEEQAALKDQTYMETNGRFPVVV